MARLNYVILPDERAGGLRSVTSRPLTALTLRLPWRTGSMYARTSELGSERPLEMDVDPDEDELRGLAILCQTFGPHLSFNDVNHSNMPPGPYVHSAVPKVYNNMPGYSSMAHQDHGSSML
ncbi:hypothetical protein F5887DRAFT_1073358 [Amanita rubescens]|nr:hypothetical protein F5887DRAFT_1073358 [Amanita rubescens]